MCNVYTIMFAHLDEIDSFANLHLADFFCCFKLVMKSKITFTRIIKKMSTMCMHFASVCLCWLYTQGLTKHMLPFFCLHIVCMPIVLVCSCCSLSMYYLWMYSFASISSNIGWIDFLCIFRLDLLLFFFIIIFNQL